MISHTTLHESNYENSKGFYALALRPLGYMNSKEEVEAF